MSDLERLVLQQSKPLGSGIAVSMSDGKGGTVAVPVEAAVFTVLDQLLGITREILSLLTEWKATAP